MLNGRLRENKKKTLDKETLYIGARLRAIRESRGLSQRALARRAGVTNGIISLIGQNRNSPSVASLKKVLEGHTVAARRVLRGFCTSAMRRVADTGKAMLRHEAEEGGIVLQGCIEIVVGDQRRILGPGDACYFDSRLPHRFRNVGKDECEIISACTTPSF